MSIKSTASAIALSVGRSCSRHMQKQAPIACSLCGHCGDFTMPPGYNVREAWCSGCGAKRRTSDLVSALLRIVGPDVPGCLGGAVGKLAELRIYEAQADGVLHAALANMPGYTCSEYLDTTPAGAVNASGIRCEDLEHLTFPDESFDLVISQDVLEHVGQPWQAFREIERVMKPGGHHLFTVPIHEGRRTITRARRENGRPGFLLQPVYHGDPLRDSGSLVYTDFGDDLADLLREQCIDARIVVRGQEYDPGEIPWIDNAEEHRHYERARTSGGLLDYFRYNSVVFQTQKSPRSKYR